MGAHTSAGRARPPARAEYVARASGAGAYVLFRFYRAETTQCRPGAPSLSLLVPLGLAVRRDRAPRSRRDRPEIAPRSREEPRRLRAQGGFVDATGGGGWGPVATSGLLADHRLVRVRHSGHATCEAQQVGTGEARHCLYTWQAHADARDRHGLGVGVLRNGRRRARLHRRQNRRDRRRRADRDMRDVLLWWCPAELLLLWQPRSRPLSDSSSSQCCSSAASPPLPSRRFASRASHRACSARRRRDHAEITPRSRRDPRHGGTMKPTRAS